MKIIYFTVITLLLLSTAGCSHRATSEEIRTTSPNIWASKDGTIKYRGYVNFAGYELLKKEYADSKIRPTTLSIKSVGGDPYAGMMIGRFIQEKGMRLEIKDYCLSACASYIFPAAKSKKFEGNSMLGFHQAQIFLKNGKQLPMTELKAKLDAIDPEKMSVNINITSKNKKIGSIKGSELSSSNTNKDTKIIPNLTDQSVFTKQVSNYYPEYSQRCYKLKVNMPPNITTENEAKQIIKSLTKSEILKATQDRFKSCSSYLHDQTEVFYSELSIDSRFSKMGMLKFKQEKLESEGKVTFFYYDKASLEALGINDVVYTGDWNPKNNRYYKYSIEIKLNDWQ